VKQFNNFDSTKRTSLQIHWRR